MSIDRITIRFKDPRDLRDLKKLAEQKNIKVNKLVTTIIIAAVDYEFNGTGWMEYLEQINEIKN